LIDRNCVADFSEKAALKMSDLPTSPSARLSDTEPDTPSSRVSCPLFFYFFILFLPLSFFPYFMIVKQVVSSFRDSHIAGKKLDFIELERKRVFIQVRSDLFFL
jgi:hypothetical protein